MLQTLPGVGKQRARDMVSKLQGKMGRFVEAEFEPGAEGTADEVTLQAVEVLTQLGVAHDDALRRVRDLREAEPEIETVEEIVRATFRKK